MSLLTTERLKMYKRFLNAIDIYRQESGLKIKEIAELAGVNRHSLGNWLAKRTMPKINTMELIADAIGISLIESNDE